MKKRSFIAIAFATLFLGATLSVAAVSFDTSNSNSGNSAVTGGPRIGAGDVTGTYVPD